MRQYVPQGLKAAARRSLLAAQLLRRRRYVFVVSHMRSYSSLLCHILGSHREVSGYVESHKSYESEIDLVDLAVSVYKTTGSLRGRILLDKVLHGDYRVSEQIHQRPDVSLIFLIREPVATIRSTIAMANRRKNPDWKSSPEKVGAYYRRRLDQMVKLAAESPAHSSILVADRIIEETAQVLDGLGTFLSLDTPLSASYETFEYTGRPIYGDPGQYIRSGRIVRERESHEEIKLGRDIVEEAQVRFQATLAELQKHGSHEI